MFIIIFLYYSYKELFLYLLLHYLQKYPCHCKFIKFHYLLFTICRSFYILVLHINGL